MEIKGKCTICLLACANWNNSSIAGLWASNWNNVRSNSNNNVGFRCDSNPQTSNEDSGLQGCVFLHYAKSI